MNFVPHIIERGTVESSKHHLRDAKKPDMAIDTVSTVKYLLAELPRGATKADTEATMWPGLQIVASVTNMDKACRRSIPTEWG